MDAKIIPLFLVALTGCVSIDDMHKQMESIYSVPSSGKSAYDGTSWKMVSTIMCDPLRFDLYQDDKLSTTDQAVIRIAHAGAISIKGGQSLLVKVDGIEHALTTNDRLTDIKTITSNHTAGNVSSKNYLTTTTLLRQMSQANSIQMRLITRSGNIDANCTDPTYLSQVPPVATIHYGLKAFLALPLK